jgi:hypothetical protein
LPTLMHRVYGAFRQEPLTASTLSGLETNASGLEQSPVNLIQRNTAEYY